jgi:hypothetical protein
MAPVPRTPEEFFGSYVPARIASLANALAGKSSPGSVVVRFDDGQTWCLRLDDGALRVTTSDAEDAIVRVYLDRENFEPLFLRSAERDELSQTGQERRLKAARALTVDAERADLVRNATGSVAIVIKEGEREHRVIATPGARAREEAACTIRLGMDEFIDLQTGRAQPLQLMMTGQLVIEGDAQIVMTLAAALSG